MLLTQIKPGRSLRLNRGFCHYRRKGAQLCMSVLRGDEPSEIDGIVRLDVRERLNRSPQRPAKNSQWTKWPFPARELIDLEPYCNVWINAHGHFLTNKPSSIMCNGAYSTDLYRAVRDALHAEVDSWSKPRQARAPLSNPEALWNRRSELESICRHASSFDPPEQKPAFSASEFAPIDEPVAARGF